MNELHDQYGAEAAGGAPEPSFEPRRGPWLLELGSEETADSRLIHPGERVVLGSGPAAGLRVLDPAVSARHCVLYATDAGVSLQDLDSPSGILLGAAQVRAATLSGNGSSFVIGRTTISIRRPAPYDGAASAPSIPGLVGRSAAMQQVAREVARHARLRAPVLIQGESGTGKDVVARALHAQSGRTGSFVPLNMGAIPEALADGELFGHRRGAFTGAVAHRAGAFELADHGTLFMDEIAELPLALQVKLLRVVEDGWVRPVGATQAQRVDVRLVSATWAPLERRIADGRFRQDLYHRLATVVIRLPPLRERKADIPELARVLLTRLSGELGPRELGDSALARLVAHDWPGNVRELGSALYRAAVAADDERIEGHHIQLEALGGAAGLRRALSSAEAQQLLARHGGNVSAAARAARVARSTFRGWLERSERRG